MINSVGYAIKESIFVRLVAIVSVPSTKAVLITRPIGGCVLCAQS